MKIKYKAPGGSVIEAEGVNKFFIPYEQSERANYQAGRTPYKHGEIDPSGKQCRLPVPWLNKKIQPNMTCGDCGNPVYTDSDNHIFHLKSKKNSFGEMRQKRNYMEVKI